MRTVPILLLVTMLAACSAKDAEPAPDTTTAVAVAATTLADFAGTWNNTVTLEGVTDPVASTFTGTADMTSWTMTLAGRDPIPLEVAVHGDSMIAESAEYESILRKGVMVRTRTASVVQDGMLMGNMIATYRTPKGEEVVKGSFHGTRAPE